MSRASIIAIDGPVAAGKSSVGRELARRLGYRFIDTGIMYRALTWKALKLGINLNDEASLIKLARDIRIDLAADELTEDNILVDGQNPGSAVRSPEVERGVSLVARVAGVREVMVARQKKLADTGKVVMVGRDIGTVVLPDADIKVYMEASARERARRRYLELTGQGTQASYDDLLAELKRRDKLDSQRIHSPLKPGADSCIIDTDKLSREQVVDKIYDLVEKN